MAGLTRSAGTPNLSSTGASKFIPQVWSSKLVTKHYMATVFGEIANTEYEGEIKAHGDSVVIRTTPDIVINDYEVGMDLNYDSPESPNTDLQINKGKYFAFGVDSVDKFQSDINLIDNWSTDAGEQMKIAIDADILGNIFVDADAANAGATAGAKSGSVDLGISATPLSITKANVIDVIVNYGLVLDEQNVPDTGRYVVLPAWMCALIKSSELKDASLAGDGTSILRNGKVGMIDRFTIYSSNNVSMSAGKTDVIFGHKKALTYASQMTEMETMKNPTKFGDLIRGLNVYGYKVIDGTCLGHSVCTKG